MENHTLIDSYKTLEIEKDPNSQADSLNAPTTSLGDSSKKIKTEKHNFERSELEKNLLIRRDFPTQELFRQNPITLYDENKKIVYKKATKPRTNKILCGTICYSRWRQLEDCLTMELLRCFSEETSPKGSSTNTNTNDDNSGLNQQLIDDLLDDDPNLSNLVPSPRNPLAEVVLGQFLEVERLQKVYEYKQSIDDTMEWHVNFADENLFVAYQCGLFAQGVNRLFFFFFFFPFRVFLLLFPRSHMLDEIQVAEMPALAHLKQALLKLSSQNEGDYNAMPRTKISKDVSSPILIHGIERLCHVRLDKKCV
jgi:hypothetical protein